jgi:hypothetical protein
MVVYMPAKFQSRQGLRGSDDGTWSTPSLPESGASPNNSPVGFSFNFLHVTFFLT